MATFSDWGQLPDVSLVKVYQYLTDAEKLNMACVCQNWNRLFSSPVLWRERKIEFTALNSERAAEKEIKFLTKYGQHLNKLKLRFGQPSFKSCALISRAAESYLRRLTLRNDIHLKEIDLDNLLMEQHWHFILSRNRLLTALCRMLRKQKYLETVCLATARMRIFDGCRVLEALAKGATSNTIKSIYMENLFETNIYPCRQIRYISAMSRFQNLQQIHLNYKYLNDQVLHNFGLRLAKTLEHLSVMVEGDLRGQEILSESWDDFAKHCSKVRVGIYLCTTILRSNDMRTPFVRGIPLTEVYMTSWARVDDTDQRLAALLTHIGNTYGSTLECFGMCFARHQVIDAELLYLLEKCNKINDVSLECRLSKDTVIAISKLHYDKKLKFKGITIVVPALTETDWAIINSYTELYLADLPSDSVNICPNDFGSSPSTSASTIEDEDDDDPREDDIFRDDDEEDLEEEDFDMEIRFQRFGDGGFLM